VSIASIVQAVVVKALVEVTFAPAPGSGAIVTLQHRHLERFGKDAVPHSEELQHGWPRLVHRYAELVYSNA